MVVAKAAWCQDRKELLVHCAHLSEFCSKTVVVAVEKFMALLDENVL